MQRIILCPRCSVTLARDRERAGQLVACPVCSRSFVMPFETSKTSSALPLMPWHLQQTPFRLRFVARETLGDF
jgi:hypothetical protein